MTAVAPPPFDFHAELIRSRAAQGLPPQLPQHLRDAVETLLGTTDAGDDDASP